MEIDKNHLSKTDILTILRAADEIIAEGGRTLLAKILKGSREKKVLQLGLDTCPVYGSFKSEKLEGVKSKIDWMINNDFLAIQYDGKLPMIVYTERGWKIEADQRADEFLTEWNQWLAEERPLPDMSYLKDRNRKMIFLFLDKVRETGDKRYISYLEAWKKVDYKKVKVKLQETIQSLASNAAIDHQAIQIREESIKGALRGLPPRDLLLKCWECGERFTFTVGEQQFYKRMGFTEPKRCPKCREKRKYGDFL